LAPGALMHRYYIARARPRWFISFLGGSGKV